MRYPGRLEGGSGVKSLVIAFAMYSKLPMPRVEWDEKSLSRALWWFPAVGLAAGGLLWLWLRLSQLLGLSTVLCAAGALLLPVAVSGGIHLDGFCDTCDALSSHQSRERKLEILKDSHTGAFAIICCCLYLICFFAVWCEALPAGRETWVLALGPVLSRSLSGLFAAVLPNARGSGLLAAFTAPMDAVKARCVLGLWTAAAGGAMALLAPWAGAGARAGAALVCLYYTVMSRRQFGGITGDLAGFFLQLCELAVVLGAAVGMRLEVFG